MLLSRSHSRSLSLPLSPLSPSPLPLSPLQITGSVRLRLFKLTSSPPDKFTAIHTRLHDVVANAQLASIIFGFQRLLNFSDPVVALWAYVFYCLMCIKFPAEYLFALFPLVYVMLAFASIIDVTCKELEADKQNRLNADVEALQSKRIQVRPSLSHSLSHSLLSHSLAACSVPLSPPSLTASPSSSLSPLPAVDARVCRAAQKAAVAAGAASPRSPIAYPRQFRQRQVRSRISSVKHRSRSRGRTRRPS